MDIFGRFRPDTGYSKTKVMFFGFEHVFGISLVYKWLGVLHGGMRMLQKRTQNGHGEKHIMFPSSALQLAPFCSP